MTADAASRAEVRPLDRPPPAPDVILVRLGPDGRVRWVSRDGATTGGERLAVARSLVEAFVDQGRAASLLERVRGGGALEGERLLLRHDDGHPRPVTVWAAPGDEPTLTLLATPPPPHGARRVEAALAERRVGEAWPRASAEQYRTLLEWIDDGFCLLQMIFDERGAAVDYRFLETNPAFERHTGLRGAAGRTIRELVPDHDAVWFERYGRVASTGEPDRFEQYAAAMGRWFDVHAVRVGAPEERRVALVFTDTTQRRRAEEALRESEHFLRQTLDSIPGLVFTNAPDGRCEFVNRPWVEFTGVFADRQLGDGWVQVLHPDDRQRAFAAWRAAVEGRESYDVEYRVRRHDGAYAWFKVQGRPIHDAAGRIVRWFGTALNVDDLKRAQAAVVEREERYRLVGRATNDVIWDWDLRAGRLDWNDAVLEHFGCTREELGHELAGWTERIHPDDRARVVEGIHAAIEGGPDAWSDEYRFRRADGSWASFFDRGYIARDADGVAVRMIGSMLDLTGRREVEAALRESEARFRALADNMSQLAWMADETGALRWYNQRWFDYTGTTFDEVQGAGWRRVHHPDHVERVTEKFLSCVRSGAPWEDTFPLRGKDGEYRWFLSRALAIRDASGKVLRWFGTNTDVTAQREAEEALHEASRRKDEFLAMLAHELRNPLAPVRYAVQVMRVIGSRDPALVRARDVVDRQVAHMARLIDDLLDVSRIARGRAQLQRERCDLASIVRQTAEDYRANLEASGLQLAVRTGAGPVWVDGDRTRLAQMVGNLLHNAEKFTGSGGRITVTLDEQPGDVAELSIEDTGVGIEPALLARLFDPFAQAAQGVDRSKGGLGLGLALVKGLVELHGGTVEARSAGHGRGSSFALRLPTLAAPAPVAPAPAARAEEAAGLRVLVIEDNRDAAESLVELLAITGHSPEVAFDGRAGLDRARATAPEVVICDIGLPGGLDGCAVARALRSEPGTSSSLLVAVSGYGQQEDRARSKAAGFDLHLVKPVDWAELERVLALRSAGAR